MCHPTRAVLLTWVGHHAVVQLPSRLYWSSNWYWNPTIHSRDNWWCIITTQMQVNWDTLRGFGGRAILSSQSMHDCKHSSCCYPIDSTFWQRYPSWHRTESIHIRCYVQHNMNGSPHAAICDKSYHALHCHPRAGTGAPLLHRVAYVRSCHCGVRIWLSGQRAYMHATP